MEFSNDCANRCDALQQLQTGMAPAFRGPIIESMVLSGKIFMLALDATSPVNMASWQSTMEVLLDRHPDEGARPAPDLQYLVPETLAKMQRLADRLSSQISIKPSLRMASLHASMAHPAGYP